MRPIDADALKQYMGIEDAVKYGNETEEQQHNSYATLMNYEIADCIDDMPTLDYAPIRHGEWEWDTLDVYMCSACGEKSHVKEVIGRPDWDYCPNCGAKMDGGKDDD